MQKPSTDQWDQHVQDPLGPDHEGERVPSMTILDNGRTIDGAPQLKIGCPECGNAFTSIFKSEQGENCVERPGDNGQQLFAKCPVCGCEWDGKPIHFYSINVMGQTDEFGDNGGGIPLAKNGTMNTIDAVQAIDLKSGVTLAQEVLTSKALQQANGILILECGRYEYRSIKRATRFRTAKDNPNTKPMALVSLTADLTREEDADNRTRRERIRIGREYAARKGTEYNPPGGQQMNDIFGLLSGLINGPRPNRDNDDNDEQDPTTTNLFGDFGSNN